MLIDTPLSLSLAFTPIFWQLRHYAIDIAVLIDIFLAADTPRHTLKAIDGRHSLRMLPCRQRRYASADVTLRRWILMPLPTATLAASAIAATLLINIAIDTAAYCWSPSRRRIPSLRYAGLLMLPLRWLLRAMHAKMSRCRRCCCQQLPHVVSLLPLHRPAATHAIRYGWPEGIGLSPLRY